MISAGVTSDGMTFHSVPALLHDENEFVALKMRRQIVRAAHDNLRARRERPLGLALIGK
jgi:hypothetical protein